MPKLTVDLENLTPLIAQAKQTESSVQRIYNQGSGALSFAPGAPDLASTYRAAIQQLERISDTLQTTYNAIHELQSEEQPSTISGAGNGFSKWLSGIKDYIEPKITYIEDEARKVVEGIWDSLFGQSVDALLDKMKANSVFANTANTAQDFVEANISSIRVREHLKQQHKEMYDFMLELAKAYHDGGEAAVDDRLAQLKASEPKLYEEYAKYADFARYFDEDTETMLHKLGDYEARIQSLQKQWLEVENDSSLTAEQKKARQAQLHKDAEELRAIMNKKFPEASLVYELLDESKRNMNSPEEMKQTMESLASKNPFLAKMLNELGRADLAIDIYNGYQDQTIKSNNVAEAEAYKQKLWETLAMAFPLAAGVLGKGMNYRNCYTGDPKKAATGVADREVVRKTGAITEGVINAGDVGPARDLVSIAQQIIFGNEGSYSTVAKDDGKNVNTGYPGGISIGKLQWHESRAYDLLVKIINKDEDTAKQILGIDSSIYKELIDRNLAKNPNRWHARTLNDAEASAISKLIATDYGKTEQDEQAKLDVQVYLDEGRALGITDEYALIYFADLDNQSPARARAVVRDAGGGKGLTIEKIHQTALADTVMGRYSDRRNQTYDKINSLINSPSQDSGQQRAAGAANYNAVLDSDKFDLTQHYLPSNGVTYCNVFTRDVMNAMGAVMPDNKRANDLYTWLSGTDAKEEGWTEVTPGDAQKAANDGKPAVVTWFNPTGASGHIAVVRPYQKGEVFNDDDIARSVVVANAGGTNYNYTTLNWVFKKDMIPKLKFFTHS